MSVLTVTRSVPADLPGARRWSGAVGAGRQDWALLRGRRAGREPGRALPRADGEAEGAVPGCRGVGVRGAGPDQPVRPSDAPVIPTPRLALPRDACHTQSFPLPGARAGEQPRPPSPPAEPSVCATSVCGGQSAISVPGARACLSAPDMCAPWRQRGPSSRLLSCS